MGIGEALPQGFEKIGAMGGGCGFKRIADDAPRAFPFAYFAQAARGALFIEIPG